ncbi:MAG: hypothetical protein WC340_17390 [Kiritimatiellia bacterium]
MSTKSIAAIMQQKHDDAVKSVTDLIWKNADGNKIADAALKGGLSPTEMETLETFISNAKSELAKLDAFDVDKIRAEAISLNAVFETADTDYKKVLAQRNDAARAKDSAAAALHEAQQAYTEIADAVELKELPSDKAPKIVNQILTRRKAGEAIHSSEQRLRELIRLKQDNQDIVDQYQKRVDQISSHKGNVTVTPGGFVSEADMLKQKLDKHTTDQKSVEKAIAKLEDEIIAAVKSYERLPNPFSIEAKAVSNG